MQQINATVWACQQRGEGMVKGCRRLTMLDVLADFSPGCVDLLITDVSVVVAHGLRPATDAFRFGCGLSEVRFSHLAWNGSSPLLIWLVVGSPL